MDRAGAHIYPDATGKPIHIDRAPLACVCTCACKAALAAFPRARFAHGYSHKCDRSQPYSQSVFSQQPPLQLGKYPIQAHFCPRTWVGPCRPGPFWVVVWVHMEGGGCPQHQQGLFFFHLLHFSLGKHPQKWALQAVEDESPTGRH